MEVDRENLGDLFELGNEISNLIRFERYSTYWNMEDLCEMTRALNQVSIDIDAIELEEISYEMYS